MHTHPTECSQSSDTLASDEKHHPYARDLTENAKAQRASRLNSVVHALAGVVHLVTRRESWVGAEAPRVTVERRAIVRVSMPLQ